MGLFSTKRANTLPSMVASSSECVSKACSVTNREREGHLNRAGSEPYAWPHAGQALADAPPNEPASGSIGSPDRPGARQRPAIDARTAPSHPTPQGERHGGDRDHG